MGGAVPGDPHRRARAPFAAPTPGRAPPALVLLLDDPDSDGFLDEPPAEATAILSRDVMPAEIVAPIEAAAAGLCVLSPDILARLLAGRKPQRNF